MTPPEVTATDLTSELEDGDKELTLAFQRGDKGAYQAIHRRHEERVLRVCRRMLGDQEDAKEAAQETFVRVYLSLGRFNGRYQLGAWISRIATNICLDHLRARSRRPLKAEAFELSELESIGGSQTDPAETIVRQHDTKTVQEVLAELPPMHRAAIVLRDFEGFTYEEIASTLEMSSAQVKALLHRARKGFKRSWASRVAALLPWPFVRRPSLKGHYGHTATSASQAVEAASPSLHSLAACSGVLQQCGQFVTERIAPTVAALLIGTTAAGAQTSTAPEVRDVAHRQAVEEEDSLSPRASHRAPRKAPSRRVHHPVADDRTDSPPPTPVEEPPAASPAPAPSPSESEAPPDDDSQSGTIDGGQATFLPAFTSALFFDGGSQTLTSPDSQSARLDCKAGTLSQELTTTISDQYGAYPAALTVQAGGSARVTLSVTKNGTTHNYDGGAASVTMSGSSNSARMEFSGSYSAIGNTNPSKDGLPHYGRFHAQLSLDCGASRVITESISFSLG